MSKHCQMHNHRKNKIRLLAATGMAILGTFMFSIFVTMFIFARRFMMMRTAATLRLIFCLCSATGHHWMSIAHTIYSVHRLNFLHSYANYQISHTPNSQDTNAKKSSDTAMKRAEKRREKKQQIALNIMLHICFSNRRVSKEKTHTLIQRNE